MSSKLVRFDAKLRVKEGECCVKLLVDNKIAMIRKHPIAHGRSKHIETKFHYMRHQVNKGKFLLEYYNNDEQVGDVFTKPLRGDKFSEFRKKLGMITITEGS